MNSHRIIPGLRVPPGWPVVIKGRYSRLYGAAVLKRFPDHLDVHAPSTCGWTGGRRRIEAAEAAAECERDCLCRWGARDGKAFLLCFDRDGPAFRWWSENAAPLVLETTSPTSADILSYYHQPQLGWALKITSDGVKRVEVVQ